MITVTPIQCKAVENSDQVRRRVFCRHYDTCLDYAIKKNWKNFSCEQCVAYEREDLDRGQMHEDYTRCIALAYYCGAIEPHVAHL